VIILDNTEAIDFESLGLNPLDPPVERLNDQAAEDAFCQRLLLGTIIAGGRIGIGWRGRRRRIPDR
jgi:hypothetical protein